MNQFTSALRNSTLTENGSPTLKSSLNSSVDLFFTIGAMRGQKDRIVEKFSKAFFSDAETATRIALWARDVRGGAGERQTFRDILVEIEKTDSDVLQRVLPKVPELGRWDDLLVLETDAGKAQAFALIRDALNSGNGLAAKWMPRKGEKAVELRNFLGLSPKEYRKTLVRLTNVVENDMCANTWDQINYEHVPSIASARYAKAFGRHDGTRYGEYLSAVEKGEKKINASAIFPYDVLRGNPQTIEVQWKALPDYLSDKKVLPMVDVSGSMMTPAGGKGSVTCMDVAVSLGLYLAERNVGEFANLAMTFSSDAKFVELNPKMPIQSRQSKLMSSQWAMSTDLDKAFERILDHAVSNRVPQEDMPDYLLILSDMEFNAGSSYYGSKTVAERTKQKFTEAGYKVPNLVWWNIQSRQDNVPVKFNEEGMALVSGFSPSIVKSILSASQIDPVSIMNETILNERYNF